MKKFLCILLLIVSTQVAANETIEIDIHGMTCAFCSDGLQRTLNKLPEITSAKVSLKHKKVQLKIVSNDLDIERIKQAIIDSGFTPGKVQRHVDTK